MKQVEKENICCSYITLMRALTLLELRNFTSEVPVKNSTIQFNNFNL